MATKNITPATVNTNMSNENMKPARKTRPRKAAVSTATETPAAEAPAAQEEQKNMNPVILASRAGRFYKVYIFNPETQTETEPWFCATPQKGMRYAFILKARHHTSINIAAKAMKLLREAYKTNQTEQQQ
mgnify:CR=1 FL=1